MSNKEIAIRLLDQLPDYKIAYAVAYLQGLSADEAADDQFCGKLIEDYQSSSDKGDFVSFDEAAKMCGVDINAIQNWDWQKGGQVYCQTAEAAKRTPFKGNIPVTFYGWYQSSARYAGFYRLRVGD